MRKAEGVPLSELQLSTEGERKYVQQLSIYLCRMYTITLDGFGRLDDHAYLQKGVVQGEKASWKDFLLVSLEEDVGFLRASGTLDIAENTVIWQLLQRYEGRLDYLERGSLLHGDLGALHVWVDAEQQKITSIIDFGERKCGDPIWDFVEYDWKYRELLLEEYTNDPVELEEAREKFYLYAVLRAIPWATRWYSIAGEPIRQWLNFVVREAEQKLL